MVDNAPIPMRAVLEYDDLETMFDLIRNTVDGIGLGQELSEKIIYEINDELMKQLNWSPEDHLWLQLFYNIYEYLIDENAISNIPEENDLDIVSTLFSAFIPDYFHQVRQGIRHVKSYRLQF